MMPLPHQQPFRLPGPLPSSLWPHTVVSASPRDSECGWVCVIPWEPGNHAGLTHRSGAEAQTLHFQQARMVTDRSAPPSTQEGAQEPLWVGWEEAAPLQTLGGPCCGSCGHTRRGLCPPILRTHPQDHPTRHAFPTWPHASPECVCLALGSRPCSQPRGSPVP